MEFFEGNIEGLPEKFHLLAEVFEAQVFEFQMKKRPDGTEDCWIPYLMNDAVECCLCLRNCRFRGEYQGEGEAFARLTREEEQYLLVVRKNRDSTASFWFQRIEIKSRFYRYHEIGHFWVTGQEQWRRLVYLVGTVYEKRQYLGENAVNGKEKEFLELITFPPFRAYSPIQESLKERYPETKGGLRTMERLSEEAGDGGYRLLLHIYRRIPVPLVSWWLKRRLNSPKRQKLYETLLDWIERASMEYPERQYEGSLNEERQKARKDTEKTIRDAGFSGTFPWFQKGSLGITVMEEHPFTILESDGYGFRMQYMVSLVEKGENRRDGGFFSGKRRKGWIEKDLSFLQEKSCTRNQK